MAHLKEVFMEAYDDNKDEKIDIAEVSVQGQPYIRFFLLNRLCFCTLHGEAIEISD